MLTGKDLGAALAQAIELKGVRKVELARHFGVTPPSVQEWIKRGVISKDKLPEIWRYFSDVVGPQHWGLDTALVPSEANVEQGPNMHGPYPVLSTVQAGRWTEICGQFQREDAQEWRHSARRLGPNGYMLRVAGQSMYAPGQAYSFPEGMILHVNPDAAPMPGQFVVVRRADSDEATFKRYVLIDGRPFLEAINPDWPKELKYLPLQPDDVWCGVVKDASLGDLP